MCLKPILIKNVNYGNKSKLCHITDSTSQYIPVPCGRCSVCLQLKQQYLVQRVQMESLSHDLFFGTLTYNDESLKFVNRGDFNLAYVDITDWQKMIKMIRKHAALPPFKYFFVTEYGSRRHRPHIHFILSFDKIKERDSLSSQLSFEQTLFNVFLKYWRRNYGSTRVPDWRNLCTYKRDFRSYNFDLHYLNPYSSLNGLDDVGFYVTKYCLKYDKWIDSLKSKLFFSLSDEDYHFVWDKLRPRRLISKGFGSPYDDRVVQHINKGIQLSLHDQSALYPYFISPVNGNTFPLSPYYSKKFMTLDDLYVFNSRKMSLTDYDMMLESNKPLSLQELQQKESIFSAVCNSLDSRTLIVDDDFSLSNLYTYGECKQISKLCEDFAGCWQGLDFDNNNFD